MTEIQLGEVVPLEELRIDMSESLCLYPPVNEIVSRDLIDYFEYCMGLTRGEIPNLPLCPEYVLKMPEDMIQWLYQHKWALFPEFHVLQAMEKGFRQNRDVAIPDRRHFQEFVPSIGNYTYTLFFDPSLQIRRLNGEVCVSGVTKVQTVLNPCFAMQYAIRFFVRANKDDVVLRYPREFHRCILSIDRMLHRPIPVTFLGKETFPQREQPSCYADGEEPKRRPG